MVKSRVNLLVCAAAGVAQLVEQLICNQQVGGSNPFASSRWALKRRIYKCLEVFGGRCPSGQREQTVNLPALPTEVRILPSPLGSRFTQAEYSKVLGWSGNSSGVRASAFQAEGRGFESRFPLHPLPRRGRFFSPRGRRSCAIPRPCSSGVERFLGKEEVTGSIPVMGSTFGGLHRACASGSL